MYISGEAFGKKRKNAKHALDGRSEKAAKREVDIVQEFDIEIESTQKEVRKDKNWTAPGIDGIHNYWWKNYELAQKALTEAYMS